MGGRRGRCGGTGERSRQESCQLPAVQTRSETITETIEIATGATRVGSSKLTSWEIFPLTVFMLLIEV